VSIVCQVCFNLADDLRNMKGKGGRLFAKRQAKSESWAVGGDGAGDEEQTPAGDGTEPQDPSLQTSTAQLRLSAQFKADQSAAVADPTPARCEAMPVNRLKAMTELPRAAMTPWEAAAKFGTVEPAFQHLDAAASSSSAGGARRDNSKSYGGNGGSGSRIKSWSGNPDAAAGKSPARTP
jgi:hypothetical protein